MKCFSYSKWAKGVAAQILESDLSSGFSIADSTPDCEKAKIAMEKLITQLRRSAGE